MTLDLEVSKAVMAAHVLERALHDAGPWFIHWDGTLQLADRLIGPSGVTFSAPFMGPGEGQATLFCGDQEMGMRDVSFDGDTFTLQWSLAAEVVFA